MFVSKPQLSDRILDTLLACMHAPWVNSVKNHATGAGSPIMAGMHGVEGHAIVRGSHQHWSMMTADSTGSLH